MKAANLRKLLCLCLAMWMTLCAPASSNAFLTEIIVGGTILAEVGGTVIAALPQLTFFASSVFALAKTSEEIADTLMSIIKFFVPGKKSDDSKPAPAAQSFGGSSSQPGNNSQVVSTQSAEQNTSSSEVSSDDAADSTSFSPKAKKVNSLMDSLIEKFPFEMALLKQIMALEEGDSERTILGDGYGELVSEVSEIRQELITIILDLSNVNAFGTILVAATPFMSC